jgi:alpha-beta hydrolase superfamily lysophospholipase
MTHTWEPHQQSPRAVVIFMHSLNGHTALCGELAKELTAAGMVVTGYDFKNFGQSGGSHRGML